MRPAPTPPAVDCRPGFRGVIRASFGPDNVLAGRHTGDLPHHDLRFEAADPHSLQDLRNALAHSRVGVRLVLAGPPADVHAAAAAAAECGLVDEEISLVREEVGRRTVYCGHCHTPTPTTQPPGAEVDCWGCGTALTTTDHFSRRVGGYLGFSAHAEERP